MTPPEDDDLNEFGLGYEARGGGKPSPAPPAKPPDALENVLFPDGAAEDPSLTLGANNAADILKALGNNSAFKDLVTKRAALNKPLINRIPPVRAQDTTIGLGPVTIQPGQTTPVSVTPGQLFKFEKVFASESVPHTTTIDNIFVGANNKMAMGTKLQSAIFNSNSLGVSLQSWTAQPGITITFTVTNHGTVPVIWAATLLGKTLA